MNTLSNLKMPRAVCCGEGALKKMPEILQAASVKKAAVFTDKGIRSASLLDPVLEQLQKSQAAFCVLDDLPPEPSYGQVQKLVDACRAEGADMILAVGGGSVMDTAKLAGVPCWQAAKRAWACTTCWKRPAAQKNAVPR